MRTFEIGYIAMDDKNHIGEQGVVRFTVINHSFERMTTELLNLFNDYITKSGYNRYRIEYVSEVVPDIIDDY